MPEGPEVYCIADQLQQAVAGAIITGLIWGPDHGRVASAITVAGLESTARIDRVYAQGKRIVFVLGSALGEETYLVTFLGMTGRWLFSAPSVEHVHLGLRLRLPRSEIRDPPGLPRSEVTLYYEDVRRMGELFYFESSLQLSDYLGKFGLDLLVTEPSLADWVALCRRPRPTTPVYGFLLNPKYNNTIGNYLASEILYYARLHPMRTMSSLSAEELERLRVEAVRVCRHSYAQGGLTISDYLTPDGKMGGYVNVCYGRDKRGDPQGRPVTRGTHGGRSYFFVAELQPLEALGVVMAQASASTGASVMPTVSELEAVFGTGLGVGASSSR